MGRLRDAASALFAPKQVEADVSPTSRRAIFPSARAAHSFGSRLTFTDFISPARFSLLAHEHGGRWLHSQDGREINVYQRLPIVLQKTRDYLVYRDDTAKMLAWQPAYDALAAPPRTFNDTIDSFLRFNWTTLGLGSAAIAARANSYYTGGSLLYLRAAGSPESPLQRGDRWFGWEHIPADLVIDEPNDAENGIEFEFEADAPLTSAPRHGIQSISFHLSRDDKARGADPIRVHGSRIIPYNEDPESKSWRTWRVPLDAHIDTLSDFRDVAASRSRGHFQGDPIIAEFDLSKDAIEALSLTTLSGDDLDNAEDETNEAMRRFRTFLTDGLGLNRGISYKRLGSADLLDPTPDFDWLAAKLSHNEPLTAEHIKASTKGSRSAGAEHTLEYEGNLRRRLQEAHWNPIIAHLLRMAQRTQQFGITRNLAADLPPLVWPRLMIQSPRDDAFTESQKVRTLLTADDLGRLGTPELEATFPRNPSVELPSRFALRGKKLDGTDAQPPEPGASNNAASPRRGAFATLSDVEGIVEDRMAILEAELREEAAH